MVDITLPFVGINRTTLVGQSAAFAYIFGTLNNSTLNYDYKMSETHNYITSGSYAKSSTLMYDYYIPRTIRNVKITDQVEIPAGAFRNCDLIETINIPEETIDIGRYAFYNCENLTRLNSNEDGIFNIPQSVNIIKDYAFYNCLEASNITISDNVKSINNYAFAKCSAVTMFNSEILGELNVPTSCEFIGEYAFAYIKLIKTINVFDNLYHIGTSAFRACTSLEEITLPFIGKSKTSGGTSSGTLGFIFGTSSYDNCSSTKQYYSGSYTTFYIPNSLRKVNITGLEIPYGSFYNCTKLTEINLNTDVIANDKAFTNCSATINYSLNQNLMHSWDGKSLSPYIGKGTENEPYLIYNGDQLYYFANEVNNGNSFENQYIQLMNDINLGKYNFIVIGNQNNNFKGNLNGNGFSIRNLTINSSQEYTGLFGYLNGNIDNLAVVNLSISYDGDETYGYCGSLAGYASSNSSISNVYVTGSMNATNSYTLYSGGLIGYNNGNINNSYSNINLKSISNGLICYAGGLIGYNNGNISNSFAYGNVNAKGSTDSYSRNGGLVGGYSSDSSVINCYRYKGQVLTKFDVDGAYYNEIGTTASKSEIILFCKENWNNKSWYYTYNLPRLKGI